MKSALDSRVRAAALQGVLIIVTVNKSMRLSGPKSTVPLTSTQATI